MMCRSWRRARCASLSVLSVILALCPNTRADAKAGQPTRYALVIGNNQPEANRQRLRYADDDAVATHQLLVQAQVRSYLLVTLDSDSRRLHLSQQIYGPPRWNRVESALSAINEQMRRDRAKGSHPELLLFFSGHGGVDRGEGYVLLQDRRLTRTMLDQQILARSTATRNHVMIDACQSYFLAFERGPGGQRRTYGQPFAEKAASPGRRSNTGFVLSTSSDRESHEWERYNAGVFSYQVRSALRGAADVDGNGAVTYGELGAFLTAANSAIVNTRLRPDFVVRPPGPPAGSLSQTVLGWGPTDSQLALDRAHVGHVYLETSEGERILDAHPTPGQRFVVRLPAKRPLFLRRVDGSWEVAIRDEGRALLSSLERVSLQMANRGAANLAFEQLFSVPFGKATVATFYESYAKHHTLEVVTSPERPSTAWRTAGTVAGWTAVAALGVGLGLQVWALERYLGGQDAPHEEREQRNETISQLNTAAFVLYGVAGVGAAIWGASRLWPGSKARSRMVATPMVAPGAGGVALSVQSNWEMWPWSF